MSDRQVTRVHYFERQFLRPADFADEQDYHVAMRRRHNISHHTWGVVTGLEVIAEEGNLYVQPGVAVDGYGRELILPQRQPLSTNAFTEKGSDELDVWLVYERSGSDEPPAGYAGCGDSARGGASFYRWQETARVQLERPDPEFPDRRRPESVPFPDLNFSPVRTPPDDPVNDWPVFLGQVAYDRSNQQQPFTVKPDDRPYVGLVGEEVAAPSGRARVQVGAELADDARRFAVFIPEAEEPGERPPRPQLSVDKSGDLDVRRDATLYGNLTMAGGAIEFEAGTARDPDFPPWSVYHLDNGAGAQELRIEMARAVTPAGLGSNRVVIGSWFKGPDEAGNEVEEFHPCLTIADDCSVTVHGNLVVIGKLHETQERTSARASSAARAYFAGTVGSGVAGGALLKAISGGGSGTGTSEMAFSRSAAAADSVEVLTSLLADDAGFRERFVQHVRASRPTLADELGKALQLIVKP